MTDATVTWLHRPGPSPLSDTAALNDIHALLTTSGDPPDLLWPVARVDAEDTAVTVRQDPAGAGLLIEITTRTAAERDALTVTLDGHHLHHPRPPGGHAA